MFTLRCTVRLQKRLRVPLDATIPEPTTRLGDWYANLVHVGRQQLVIALSERTLLPVVVEAAPGEALVPRLVMAVTKALTTLAIPSGDISREIAAMSDVAFGKTGSRQVVGVMVDLANALQYYARDGGSLHDVSMRLGETPCSPLYTSATSPDRETIALFRGPPLRVVK